MCQRHVPSLSLSLSPLFSQPHAGSHGSKRNQKGGGGGKKVWVGHQWLTWLRQNKKEKNYTREASEGERNQSSPAEWKQ